MITLRPFDKRDWQTFAGAERAPDGTEPHIADHGVTINGDTAIVVADAEGVQVIPWHGNYTFAFVMKNIHAAIAFAGALPAELDIAYLEKHGFSHL